MVRLMASRPHRMCRTSGLLRNLQAGSLRPETECDLIRGVKLRACGCWPADRIACTEQQDFLGPDNVCTFPHTFLSEWWRRAASHHNFSGILLYGRCNETLRLAVLVRIIYFRTQARRFSMLHPAPALAPHVRLAVSFWYFVED